MTHQPRPAFFCTAGPDRPRIVLVGEAWGQSEEESHKPFAGESGKELFRLLGEAMPEIEPELHREVCAKFNYGLAWIRPREAWFEAAGVSFTNVLAFRPPGKIEDLCLPKKEAGEYAGSFAAISRGKYLREEFLPELDRLQTELHHWGPNLVVALGNTATWALLQATNIGTIRGSVTSSDGCGTRGDGKVLDGSSLAGTVQKVLATYHPAAVLRAWHWRPIVVADLMKAHREGDYPEVRRLARRVLVSPTLDEMEAWEVDLFKRPPPILSPDIETASGQITCIGFAKSPAESMVIPFWDRGKPGLNYWPDQSSEVRAWRCMKRMLESDIPKLFQNGIYDIQYLTKYGVQPRNCIHDTMLLHHSLFPEMQKGLGFLGSIYTGESSWKLLRKRKADTVKADD